MQGVFAVDYGSGSRSPSLEHPFTGSMDVPIVSHTVQSARGLNIADQHTSTCGVTVLFATKLTGLQPAKE